MTTRQASERFEITKAHIRLLLEREAIQGVKVGRDWFVLTSSLEHYMANRPKPGPKPRRKR